MGLTNNERRTFLGIAEGKITLRKGNGESIKYDNFEGELKSIKKRDTMVNNSPITFYDFEMEDRDGKYTLSLQHNSSSARTLILCIGSIENIKGKTVKISPWLSTGKDGSHKDKPFTNVTVYVDGQKTKWAVETLPPTKTVQVGSQTVKDDSERVALVEKYISIINNRLSGDFDPETGEIQEPVVDVENFDDLPPENLG